MKKYLLSLIMLVSFVINAQKETIFENRIHPERTYLLSMEMSATMETRYDSATGLSKIQDTLVKTQTSTKISRTISTGKSGKDKHFAASMKFNDFLVKTNGKEMSSPVIGTVIMGKYGSGNELRIDSVVNPKLDRSTLASIKTSLENSKPDISFPDKPLKIGDSFRQKLPMNIPVDDYQISSFIERIFTLKSIKSGIAVFDLKEIITLNNDKPQEQVTASGAGNGIMEFHIKENQVIRDESRSQIAFQVLIDDLITKGIINTESVKLISID